MTQMGNNETEQQQQQQTNKTFSLQNKTKNISLLFVIF